MFITLTAVIASITLLLTQIYLPPNVYIDGHAFTFEVNEQDIIDSTHIPMLPIFEKMGFTFHWDEELWQATFTGDEYTLIFTSYSTGVIVSRTYSPYTSYIDPFTHDGLMIIDDELMVPPGALAYLLRYINIWAQWYRGWRMPATLYISTELEMPQNLPEWSDATREDVRIRHDGSRVVNYQREVIPQFGLPFDEFVQNLAALGGEIIGSRQDLVTYQVYFHGLEVGELLDFRGLPAIRSINYISTRLLPYTTPIYFGDLLTVPRRDIPQYRILHTGQDAYWVNRTPRRDMRTTAMVLQNMEDVYEFINSGRETARRQIELAYFTDEFFDRYVLLIIADMGTSASIEPMEFTQDTMYFDLHDRNIAMLPWRDMYFMVAIDRREYRPNLHVRHTSFCDSRQYTLLVLPPITPLPPRTFPVAIALGGVAAFAGTLVGYLKLRKPKTPDCIHSYNRNIP